MKKAIMLICAFIMFLPIHSKAETANSGRDEIFAALRGGFDAQVSLSEEPRTKQEIKEILNPFFTDDYIGLFWEENVVEENGKYVTYGSDFAQYYIPFYNFSESTEVVQEGNKAYVFEFFPESTEGPVGYDSHYEGLLLTKEDGNWKVSRYLYNQIPESVLNKSAKQVKTKKAAALKNLSSGEESELSGEAEAASLQFQMGMNPISSLFQYAAFLGSNDAGALENLLNSGSEQLALEN
ncbi:DUF3993 domain-containing protein [Bacillus sp. B-jedd]|uniref:DUF3993 domain-containing protein n=1 Tax=Bacillus sp. B-jedd TaxID=1476857 RepID=UPI0005156079|nr:DUF3993 domain-containing protein [Bacillus sp. B-jedd]CEG26643.1 group-specific protein [Bacillus sp. B-jedd]